MARYGTAVLGNLTTTATGLTAEEEADHTLTKCFTQRSFRRAELDCTCQFCPRVDMQRSLVPRFVLQRSVYNLDGRMLCCLLARSNLCYNSIMTPGSPSPHRGCLNSKIGSEGTHSIKLKVPSNHKAFAGTYEGKCILRKLSSSTFAFFSTKKAWQTRLIRGSQSKHMHVALDLIVRNRPVSRTVTCGQSCHLFWPRDRHLP